MSSRPKTVRFSNLFSTCKWLRYLFCSFLFCHIPRLNSGSSSFFWEWYFWFWRWFWGFLTIANSMVQKVWTNFMGVFRYSLGKFNYFWPFCVGLAYMCGRNALKLHSGTKLDIVNKLELLIWCFANIHSKPRPKIPVFWAFYHLWTPPRNIPTSSHHSGLV